MGFVSFINAGCRGILEHPKREAIVRGDLINKFAISINGNVLSFQDLLTGLMADIDKIRVIKEDSNTMALIRTIVPRIGRRHSIEVTMSSGFSHTLNVVAPSESYLYLYV